MNDIALVTANFSGIDDLKPLPRHDGIDAFYYTDAAGRAQADAAALASWTRVLVPDYPRHDFGARLRSRYFKHQIHRLDEVRRHRWLVWADSSLRFHDLSFVHAEIDKLARLPLASRVLLVPHPDRKTVRQEFEYIQGMIDGGNEYLRIRYADEKMKEQMRYYAQQGWDVEARLWCGGFWLVENSDLFFRLWNDWWDQNLRFGMMDQLSLPVLLARYGCAPQSLPVLVWNNNYFSYVQHQRHI